LAPVKKRPQYWYVSHAGEWVVMPSKKLLVTVTRLLASLPRTRCCRPMSEVVTRSIHTRSVPESVIASPPQTYWGLRFVILTFWMIMLLTPLDRRRPLPLSTPLLPTPIRLLFDFT